MGVFRYDPLDSEVVPRVRDCRVELTSGTKKEANHSHTNRITKSKTNPRPGPDRRPRSRERDPARIYAGHRAPQAPIGTRWAGRRASAGPRAETPRAEVPSPPAPDELLRSRRPSPGAHALAAHSTLTRRGGTPRPTRRGPRDAGVSTCPNPGHRSRSMDSSSSALSRCRVSEAILRARPSWATAVRTTS